MWGALIGGALSLFGAKKQADAEAKAVATANEANTPAAQRAAYEEAGINPLMGMSSGSWVPQQASSASIGDGFAAAGSSIQRGLELQHSQELQQTAISQENEMLKTKLDELSAPQTIPNIQRIGLGPVSDLFTVGNENLDRFGNSQTTGLDVASLGITTDRSTSDAEVAETRYGDVGGSLYGLIPMGRDAGKTVANWFDDSFLQDAIVDGYVNRQKKAAEREQSDAALMDQLRAGTPQSNYDLLFGDFYYN